MPHPPPHPTTATATKNPLLFPPPNQTGGRLRRRWPTRRWHAGAQLWPLLLLLLLLRGCHSTSPATVTARPSAQIREIKFRSESSWLEKHCRSCSFVHPILASQTRGKSRRESVWRFWAWLWRGVSAGSRRFAADCALLRLISRLSTLESERRLRRSMTCAEPTRRAASGGSVGRRGGGLGCGAWEKLCLLRKPWLSATGPTSRLPLPLLRLRRTCAVGRRRGRRGVAPRGTT
eukprot:COSAG04_NODE_724_length_10804_cov_4.547221_4_plen_233_part_00